jgi:hypothetical protein
MRKLIFIAAALAASAPALAASVDPAYRYSGTHAGGPADALIPTGVPQPVRHVYRDPAYAYSGTHAGGPADALIPAGVPQPVRHVYHDPAYAYSGTHAGGPADALIGQPGPVTR